MYKRELFKDLVGFCKDLLGLVSEGREEVRPLCVDPTGVSFPMDRGTLPCPKCLASRTLPDLEGINLC